MVYKIIMIMQVTIFREISNDCDNVYGVSNIVSWQLAIPITDKEIITNVGTNKNSESLTNSVKFF